MERIGIYPGTFDPITLGHMDVIRRSLGLVDRLVLAVAADTDKSCLFSLEERRQMAEYEIEQLPVAEHKRIEVRPFAGLLVGFAREVNATIIIRGLRAVSDFEYEFQMACMNSRLDDGMETVFLPAAESMQFVSSRFIKQVCRLGGDISSMASERVAEHLRSYFAKMDG